MTKPTLNPALREFWSAKARYKVLYGGRISSKSWDAAGVLIAIAQAIKIKVLCTRQFQVRITDSVYSLLKVQIERFGLNSIFNILDNKIVCKTTGSEFVFYGLWRNPEEIKSLEGIDIAWHEEAALMTKYQWDIIEPTVRKEGSQHWFIFNPHLATDYIYKKFVVNPPRDAVVRLINYDENPFISQTSLDVINALKESDYEEYSHIYLGVPRDSDDDALIKRSHIMASIDLHLKHGFDMSGKEIMGFDIADGGKDECAYVKVRGTLLYDCYAWKTKHDESIINFAKAYHAAKSSKSAIIYDAVGVGSGAGSNFKNFNVEQNENVEFHKFFAGGGVNRPDQIYKKTGIHNKIMFADVKAQVWMNVSDMFMNSFEFSRGNLKNVSQDEMIFIDSNTPNLTKIIEELSTPKKQFNQASKIKVESKKDLKTRGFDSPNLADAVIMAYSYPYLATTTGLLDYYKSLQAQNN